MTEPEAIQILTAKRKTLEIPPEMKVVSAERAIVQYKQNMAEPGPAEDRISWIVTLSCQWGMAEVHIDDLTGEAFQVKRSA